MTRRPWIAIWQRQLVRGLMLLATFQVLAASWESPAA